MAAVLIIDDEASIVDLLAETFTKASYEVYTAGGGAKALDIAKAYVIDLVITDLIMPKIDGIQVINQIRRYSPNAKIIAISGGGRGGLQNQLPLAKIMGANATVEKPFTGSELLELADQLLA